MIPDLRGHVYRTVQVPEPFAPKKKDPKIAYKTINARVETVDTAPSYRQAFKKRRCLISADGFYEWKKVVGGKVPYSIGMKDNSPFVFAGLWEGWKEPATGEWLHTCTIITGEPNELVAQIHTRMPVILGQEHEAWLSNQAGKEVLVPLPRRRNESVADQSAREQSQE